MKENSGTLPEVLFADEDMVVVNKPAGVTVIPDRIHTDRATVQSMLEKKFGKLWVVHRIDRGTSGVLCFARNEAAHRHLSLQFQNHAVVKHYKALVKGRLKSEAGSVDAPIAENPAKPGTMMTARKGKEALTHYKLEEQFRHAALVDVEIKTGRTHQIRVHLASIGNALLVDEVYGGSSAFYFSSIKRGYKQTAEEERPTIDRLTLHASSISLKHPATDAEVTFTAPLPKDMETVLKILRKYDAL